MKMNHVVGHIKKMEKFNKHIEEKVTVPNASTSELKKHRNWYVYNISYHLKKIEFHYKKKVSWVQNWKRKLEEMDSDLRSPPITKTIGNNLQKIKQDLFVERILQFRNWFVEETERKLSELNTTDETAKGIERAQKENESYDNIFQKASEMKEE